MKSVNGRYWLGWLPDYPDYRDYTVATVDVKPMLNVTGVLTADSSTLPETTDLRKWCSGVEDQKNLGSCTANAGVGMLEYYERRASGKHMDGSRLFLYKTTRNLVRQKGDTGACLRTTVGALALFGLPPEEYWPYEVESFDVEPPAFCYAFAQSCQAIKYVRLDPPDAQAADVLRQIKINLAAGLPSMFGFTVYSSVAQADSGGLIPFPCRGEKVLGGHAVMAVGYDDSLKIRNAAGDTVTEGALLIRNSWGAGWGDHGYGWLPYQYLLNGLARDWWTILDSKWIDTGEFKV